MTDVTIFTIFVCMCTGALHRSLSDSILASGCRFWVSASRYCGLGVDFGTLCQSWALGADFVHLGVGFGVCENMVSTYDNIDKSNAKLQYNIDKKL